MQNPKLFSLLKSLDQNEFKHFKDFIYSPTFNKNKNIIALFDGIKKFYPDFKESELSDEKLFAAVYGKEKFNYFKIKNIISDLLMLGKEFLSFNKFKKESYLKEKFLLEELRLRNLDTLFEQTFKSASKRLEETQIKDETYFLKKVEFTNEIMSYFTPKMPNKNFHYMQEILDHLVNYSVISLLKRYNILLHERTQNNYEFNLTMFENVMDYLKSNKTVENPTLLAYYNIILLETEKEDKYFYELKKLKSKHKDELNEYDNYMIYLHMDSYCASAYNEFSRTDLLREQFLLSKENTMNYSAVLGKVLYPDFLNEIKKAVRVNEFEYAENYISTFSHCLSGEKESTLNFCYGFINYKKGELDTALDFFSKAHFPNFIIKVQVKILLLQLYYEKEYFDQAILMADTFRHYLIREKMILENIRNPLLDFVRITADLIKLKIGIKDEQTNYKLNKIKKQIKNMKNNRFGFRLWLVDRISEFG